VNTCTISTVGTSLALVPSFMYYPQDYSNRLKYNCNNKHDLSPSQGTICFVQVILYFIQMITMLLHSTTLHFGIAYQTSSLAPSAYLLSLRSYSGQIIWISNGISHRSDGL